MNKSSERRVVEEFISHPSMKLLVRKLEDSETPDFIIHLLNSKVSLEHTRLISPKQKQKESFQKKIIKLAEDKFISLYNASLNVGVSFSYQPMNTKDMGEEYFVALIFNIIESIYLSNKERGFNITTKDFLEENKYIRTVYVHNDVTRSLWQKTGAYLVEYADLKWIQSVINKKSTLITQYNNTFAERWLLLEASIGHQSSGFRFEHIGNNLEKSGFDRVFIYERRPKELIEIP